MKNVPIYIDLVFCLVVLPLAALVFPVERWAHYFPVYIACSGLWLYAVYFTNRYISVPWLFAGSCRCFFAIAFIIISLVGTYFIADVQLYQAKPHHVDAGITRIFPFMEPYQTAVWSLFMIDTAFSFAISLMVQANLQRSRLRTAEAMRDKAELKLYKAQIKPHFMFNSLNSLYGLFLTGNEKALESLEKFISMTRYIHTTSHQDLVPLADEVRYIGQYVDMQALRLNNKTKVNLNIDIESDDLSLPPMLLMTFVENCFTHGVSSDEDSCISISIIEKHGLLEFSTSNTIFPSHRQSDRTGIDNARRRLQLLYPHRHSLIAQPAGHVFEVKLSISLSQPCPL